MTSYPKLELSCYKINSVCPFHSHEVGRTLPTCACSGPRCPLRSQEAYRAFSAFRVFLGNLAALARFCAIFASCATRVGTCEGEGLPLLVTFPLRFRLSELLVV